jgi:hypothetical protein
MREKEGMRLDSVTIVDNDQPVIIAQWLDMDVSA